MRKKYKPKLSFKKKKEIAIRVVYFLFIAGIAISAILFYGTVKKYLLTKISFPGGRISSVNAELGDSSSDSEVKRYLSHFTGQKFDEKIKESIYEYFAMQKPFVTGLKINHNPITGRLSVSGVIEKPIARIKNSSDLYILESGKLVRNPQQQGEFLIIDCVSDCTFEADFASFLVKLKEIADKKGFAIHSVSYEGKNSSPRVFIPDLNEINWGDYRFTEEKIDRVKSVLEDLKRKSDGPFNIDLRLFDRGRIVVSEKKQRSLPLK